MLKGTLLRSTASFLRRSPWHRASAKVQWRSPQTSSFRARWKTTETWTGALFRTDRLLAYKQEREPALEQSSDEEGHPSESEDLSDDDELLSEDTDPETGDDAVVEAADQDFRSEAKVQSGADSDDGFAEWQSLAVLHESVETKGLTWATTALALTRELLDAPPLDALTLHSFKVDAHRRRIYIALDKFFDTYGSPSLDEITLFTEQLTEQLSERLDEAVVGSLNFEVSSPGAERAVRLPFELERFQHLPMSVIHRLDDNSTSTKMLEFQRSDIEADTTVWRYWKGRHNKRIVKIRKADYERDLEIPLADILSAHLVLDI